MWCSKKPGKLNSHEYGQIKEHVVITRSILEKMHLTRKYKNVPQIASAHHECLDGSGYPEGLTMKEIPYMSKVIVVADIFEALTSDRAYRQAMPVEEAFNEIEKDAGVKYDTSVIAALKRYYEKKYK